jgi:hypothetical protein
MIAMQNALRNIGVLQSSLVIPDGVTRQFCHASVSGATSFSTPKSPSNVPYSVPHLSPVWHQRTAAVTVAATVLPLLCGPSHHVEPLQASNRPTPWPWMRRTRRSRTTGAPARALTPRERHTSWGSWSKLLPPPSPRGRLLATTGVHSGHGAGGGGEHGDSDRFCAVALSKHVRWQQPRVRVQNRCSKTGLEHPVIHLASL